MFRKNKLSSPSLSDSRLQCSRGSEIQRGGLKTRARGLVDSSTGKKAIGETLDAQIAGLKKGFGGKDAKGTATKKEKTEGEKMQQALQKDIKAFLVLRWVFSASILRLAAKSSKFRDAAQELKELGVPHQEVPSLKQNALYRTLPGDAKVTGQALPLLQGLGDEVQASCRFFTDLSFGFGSCG